MGRHSTKVRAPRFKPLFKDPLRPGRHTPGRQKKEPPAAVWHPTPSQWERLARGEPVKGVRLQPAAPRPNVRQKAAQGGARANIERRSPRQGESFATQISRTPANREWREEPGRRKASGGGARAELGRRADAKAPTPHPKSGEGARATVKARGVAPRPASPMPGDPEPVARGRRSPQTSGKSFAGGFFR